MGNTMDVRADASSTGGTNSADEIQWLGTMNCCTERDHPQRTADFKTIRLVSRTDHNPRGQRENSGGVAYFTGMHGF